MYHQIFVLLIIHMAWQAPLMTPLHFLILVQQSTPIGFFDGDEFAWANSAYLVNSHTIPIHKQPASFIYKNALFDGVVLHLRVQSEHCIWVLKGRFQCPRGLQVEIKSNKDHVDALQWITAAIILHNLIIDVEGHDHTHNLLPQHGGDEGKEDHGPRHASEYHKGDDAMQRQLVAEFIAYKCMWNPNEQWL